MHSSSRNASYMPGSTVTTMLPCRSRHHLIFVVAVFPLVRPCARDKQSKPYSPSLFPMFGPLPQLADAARLVSRRAIRLSEPALPRSFEPSHCHTQPRPHAHLDPLSSPVTGSCERFRRPPTVETKKHQILSLSGCCRRRRRRWRPRPAVHGGVLDVVLCWRHDM